LTPLAVGDAFTLREWPLHVTVAPTFVIVGGLPAVLSARFPDPLGATSADALRRAGGRVR